MSTNQVPSALVVVAQRTGGPMVTQTLPTGWPVLMSVTVPDSDGSTAKAGVAETSRDAAMRAVASKGLIKRMSVISLLKWLGLGNVAGVLG